MLGEAVFPRSIADLLISSGIEEASLTPSSLPSLGNELSKREIEILRCLLGGQSNKAIARNLSITESTVKMHFKNVMRKIRAQNRTQAAVWAIQHGISPRLSA
jgi:two-component system nitrate/nitrite response regulator NarL